MSIRFARQTDLPSLLQLWQEAFPADSGAQISAFLASLSLESECIVADNGTGVVSMACLLPAVLRFKNEQVPVQYLYAAATRRSYRGQGIFGRLLRTALEDAKAKGFAASFLRPAEPSLVDYYRQFGYQPFFYSCTQSGIAAERAVAVTATTPTRYVEARRRWLPACAVCWEPRFLSGTVLLGEQGDEGCALCEPRGEVLFISELLCDPARREEFGGGLAAQFGCVAYECRFPGKESEEPFGLLCPLAHLPNETNAVPYMGPALD